MKRIILRSSPKTYTLDQDKTASPEQTIRRFHERIHKAGLDIFQSVRRVDQGRLGIPVYASEYGPLGQALAGKPFQMGKGGTPLQAEASAVMELAERFSFFRFRAGEENFLTATRSDVPNPMDLDLIVASVHDDTPQAATALDLFSQTPLRWCEGTDLVCDRSVHVPFDWFCAINEFNGACAGNKAEEALCQGMCEVVERHACALVSQNRLAVPGIRPESVTDPMARELLGKFEKAGIKIHVSDFSLGLGVATISALAYDPATLGPASEIVWTAGASPDPHKALCRALTEAAQLAGDFNSRSVYLASGLPKPKALAETDFIRFPDRFADIRDLPDLSDKDMKIEAERVIAACASRGLLFFAVDTTHPLLGIPAFFTFAPGARFRERAANGSVGMFLAKIITEREQPARALEMLLSMEHNLPGTYYLPFYEGVARLAECDAGAALADFQRALDCGPTPEDAASVLVYTGEALKDQGKFGPALEALEKARALDDSRTDCHNLMGFCNYKLKRHAQAIACFTKVLDLDPGSALDHANIGANYREMGQRDLAIRYFERALDLDPGIAFARENLEKLKGREAQIPAGEVPS